MSVSTFKSECPFCESKEIESWGHINNNEISNSEQYICNGKCGKTFYMQYSDERMIMKYPMKKDYLSIDSQAFYEKEMFKKIALKEEVLPRFKQESLTIHGGDELLGIHQI